MIKSAPFFSIAIIATLIISYTFFSYENSPVLNSDGAINVLMTHYFSLPDDLYFWGQDRGGSLIPLISQIWLLIPGMTAIKAVSISTYLIHFLGYLGFSSYLKNKSLKLFLCAGMFLPAFLFSDYIWYTIGLQVSLLGIFAGLAGSLDLKSEIRIYSNQSLKLLLLIIITTLAVWVSDTSLPALLIFQMLILNSIRKYNSNKSRLLKTSSFVLAANILIIGFIFYLKSFASTTSEGYSNISYFREIAAGFTTILSGIYNNLIFEAEDALTSIFVWLSIIGIALLPKLLHDLFLKINGIRIQDQVFIKWIIYSIIILLIINSISHWVFINGMGRRYYISVYLFLLLLFLKSIDVLNSGSNYYKICKMLAFVTIITGSISTIYHYKFKFPKTLKSSYSRASEFRKLGQIGLISEYWNSYINSIADPSATIATPHDQAVVRNFSLSEKVFKQPKIYVIKDMWLDQFPDSMNQFNHFLLKSGEPIHIADCVINEYKLLK